ncbi:T9SS type A sorting domain-containing protein [Winogradskyella sp. SYSU M77433]|uniref:T9SS type A sorting domain-containing protein n=1 Tax=Winogradskyella sp. SYSU M77433 TaxID=3042722 RepID=UPI002481110A|nr:T9SS type A sorting domain-containing protein [Winogradskyella sp. SYSU M77433]MDH7914173.1 T9SS type A sorting domain-containing protein [Winogradskyella sp. SYSU M77433]
MKKNYFLFILTTLFFNFSFSQEYIAVAQNTSDIVLLLDPTDGSVVDYNFIDLTSLAAATPKDILQVNDELWISDQIADRIDIFDLSGSYINTISSSIGLDNIRGMALVNGEVWVCNAGGSNEAPGTAIVRLNTDGTLIGSFATPNSPFDVIDTGTEAIISFISSNSIERYDYSGNSLSTITTSVNFPQQLQYNSSDNSIYVTGFSSPSGLYKFDVATGTQQYYSSVVSSLRGVIELDNGEFLVSNSSGVFSLDTGSNTSTSIISGSSQYFTRVDLTPLSIEEETLESFGLYPNPAKNFLNIKANVQFNKIVISNSLGQTVSTLDAESNQDEIDISQLNSGIYIVTLESDTGKQVKKFIKN